MAILTRITKRGGWLVKVRDCHSSKFRFMHVTTQKPTRSLNLVAAATISLAIHRDSVTLVSVRLEDLLNKLVVHRSPAQRIFYVLSIQRGFLIFLVYGKL